MSSKDKRKPKPPAKIQKPDGTKPEPFLPPRGCTTPSFPESLFAGQPL